MLSGSLSGTCGCVFGYVRSERDLTEKPLPTRPYVGIEKGFSFSLVYGRIYIMLKIRLQRTGRKNDPHFRLIVTESTLKPKTTQFAEIVGTYNVKA